MRRVVISGLGITSGIGNDLKTFRDHLYEMVSGIGKVETFDTSKYRFNLGSTVKEIASLIPRSARRLPRPHQFMIHAATNAIEQSGILDSVVPERIGCYLAGPACSIFDVENFYSDYVAKGISATDAYDLAYANGESATNEIGRRFGLMGPRNTVLTACSSSGVAIGLAFDLIRLGIVDAMVSGGTDGFSEFTFSGFQSLNSISPEPCKPFDRDRSGLSFGEGAGALILEDFEHAKARGATIYAELVGYGAIGEGYNLTAPHPDGLGYVRTMSRALAMAKINPDEVGYINAHGTATAINDAVEGLAIRKVFGDYKVPVNSIKSLVGHCMGAAGAVEAVNSILTLHDQVVPGTKNYQTPDAEIGANVLKETVKRSLKYVLSNSAGFGGNNSSLLFGRV